MRKFLGNIHYKYFSNDEELTPIGFSGMVLDGVRIILYILMIEYYFAHEYTVANIIFSILFSFVLSPILILPFIKLLSNKGVRFLKGAYIPIPYLLIWILGK